MKYYKYYQPNIKDLKDEQGDCAIRALTKFYGITWLEAFDMLVEYARKSQTTINSLTNIKHSLRTIMFLILVYISQNPKIRKLCLVFLRIIPMENIHFMLERDMEHILLRLLMEFTMTLGIAAIDMCMAIGLKN